MNRERVLTGIRSNDKSHLGNYLGAMLPMVEIQKKHGQDHDMFFFVPDLHSFTTPINYADLYENTLRNIRYFIAAGMDFWADGAYIYRQSYIPAHSELTWILDCFAYFGEMQRMTQFKEKAAKADNASIGLLNYPVLMAADILLYNAKYVPVGDDQRQHLEIARDLAIRINNKFSDVFEDGVFQTVPLNWKEQLAFAKRDNGVRIRSLRTPEKKMSKSVNDPAGTIDLEEDPKSAAKKIMSATTDSVGEINLDWDKQPGISNLIQIEALLSNRGLNETAAKWQGKTSYGDLKKSVAEKVEKFLIEFQTKLNATDNQKIISKLEQDEQQLQQIANATLLRAQQAVGLRPKK